MWQKFGPPAVRCEFATFTATGAQRLRGWDGRKQETLDAALEPASPAVPTAAADKQHYDYDDQKSCGVHAVLQIAYERDRGKCNPENPKKATPGPRGR